MFSFLSKLNPHDVLSIAALAAGLASLIVHRIGHVNHRVLIDDIAEKLSSIENATGGPPNGDLTTNPPT